MKNRPAWPASTVDRLEQRRGAAGLGDHGQVGVLEAHGARVEHLDPHVVEDGPQRVQARLQHRLDAAVHPHDGALVVLEVHDPGLVAQGAGLRDHVQVLVVEPDVAHGHDVHADLAQGIPDEVTARTQDALELAVRNSRPRSCSRTLKRRNSTHNVHLLSEKKASGDGPPAATPRAWSAT